ncbi:MAG: ABC transporter ATP-binding protein [Candidatus Heimdallarchaeota archaeon]|nr:MAG: ABC transporter ATP-binding protein [Candidatus Heimdallarchaeota archaeon]
MGEEIQIQNVSKVFRVWRASLRIKVIDDLSLSISAGDSVLLLGPNGSGKSTLLRMVASLLTPSQGNILIYGYNTRRRSRALLNLLGFMPEECKFHHGISGLTFLFYLSKLMGLKDPKNRALNLIDEFGLTKWRDIDVSVYSEGMRQRLGLCSALLNDPNVLLLDEPYDNLDQEMRAKLKRFLQEYTENNNIVIAASHNKEHFTNFREIRFPIEKED